MLRELYSLGRFVEASQPALLHRLQGYLREREEQDRLVTEANLCSNKLRANFKNGGLDQRTYQRLRREQSDLISRAHLRIERELFEKYFGDTFHRTVPWAMRKVIVDYLQRIEDAGVTRL